MNISHMEKDCLKKIWNEWIADGQSGLQEKSKKKNWFSSFTGKQKPWTIWNSGLEWHSMTWPNYYFQNATNIGLPSSLDSTLVLHKATQNFLSC